MTKEGKLPYKCVMKVYKIKITSFVRGGIWYTKKVGNEYYAVLTVKGDKSPVFRLVDVNEDRDHLTSLSLILEVYPIDCNIVEEFIIKSYQSLKHICI